MSDNPYLTSLLGGKKPRRSATFDEATESLIEKHSTANGLDSELVRRLITQESSGKSRAVSPKGAQGLMQLMPGTAARFGVKDSFDPDQNIGAGTKYLRWLLDRYEGDVTLALAGYNAGEGAVDKHGRKVPPYRETQDYVKKIGAGYTGSGYAGKPAKPAVADNPFFQSLTAGRIDEDVRASGPQPPVPPEIDLHLSETAPAELDPQAKPDAPQIKLPKSVTASSTVRVPVKQGAQGIDILREALEQRAKTAGVKDTKSYANEALAAMARAGRNPGLHGPDGRTPLDEAGMQNLAAHGYVDLTIADPAYDQLLFKQLETERAQDAEKQLKRREQHEKENHSLKTAIASPDKLAADLRWHFGVNDMAEFARLPRDKQRKMILLATEAAANDEKKKAQGQEIEPSLEYQNLMRRRVGLADNPALIDPRTPLLAAAGRFRLDGPTTQELLNVRPGETFMPGYQASGSARGKVQVTPGPTGIGELRQAEATQDRQEGEERQRLHDEMRRDAVLNVMQQRNALEGTGGATDQQVEALAISHGLGPEIDREQTRLAREQLAIRDRARRAIANSSGNPDSALSGSVASIMSVVDAIATAPTGGISPVGVLPSDIARKLLTPTQEGSLGTWETVAETFKQNPAKLAPILGAVVDYANSANQRAAGTRVALGEASERDKIMLMRMQALEDEGRPFAAQLAEGLINNVSFMLEMAVSGGAAGPVKAGVKRGLTGAVGKAAIHKAGKPALFGVRAAAEIPATAARLPYFLPRTMATYERRVMEGEDPKVAKFYALLDTYTEILSEASGGASKYIPLLNRVKTPKWLKSSYETLRKAGYHGTLPEYAEERVKDVMDMATGVRDIDDVIAGWQKPQQHLLELAQFAIPGMAMAAANRVLAIAGREQQIAFVRQEFDVDRDDANEIIDLLTGKRNEQATPEEPAESPEPPSFRMSDAEYMENLRGMIATAEEVREIAIKKGDFNTASIYSGLLEEHRAELAMLEQQSAAGEPLDTSGAKFPKAGNALHDIWMASAPDAPGTVQELGDVDAGPPGQEEADRPQLPTPEDVAEEPTVEATAEDPRGVPESVAEPAPAVEKDYRGREVVRVKPERLAHGANGKREGDIAASYSADRIADGKGIRKPFEHDGALWVSIGGGPGNQRDAVRIVPLADFDGETMTYAESLAQAFAEDRAPANPNGLYHGMTVTWKGKPHVLVGPPRTFAVEGEELFQGYKPEETVDLDPEDQQAAEIFQDTWDEDHYNQSNYADDDPIALTRGLLEEQRDRRELIAYTQRELDTNKSGATRLPLSEKARKERREEHHRVKGIYEAAYNEYAGAFGEEAAKRLRALVEETQDAPEQQSEAPAQQQAEPRVEDSEPGQPEEFQEVTWESIVNEVRLHVSLTRNDDPIVVAQALDMDLPSVEAALEEIHGAADAGKRARKVGDQVFVKNVPDGPFTIARITKQHGTTYYTLTERYGGASRGRYAEADLQDSKPESGELVGLPHEIPAEPKPRTVKTERGTRATVWHAVVDAADLLTSLDEGYPAQFQPRDRTRAASREQISRIANNLDPDFLDDSPKASEGRPLVITVQSPRGQKYAVISGNGRVLGIKEAYNLDRAQAYQSFAKTKDPDTKASRPVYVGIITEIDSASPQAPEFEEMLQAFAREANESGVARMSAVEQAQDDAKAITSELMRLFYPSDDGDVNTAANREFIRRFVTEVAGTDQRGQLLTDDGRLSVDGVNRVRNAIFAKAYGGSKEGLNALAKMAEDPDNNIRQITNAMLVHAGGFAELKENIAAGTRHDLDISEDLVKAAAKLSQLREDEMSVEHYLRQGSMFGEDLDTLQRRILVVLNEHKRSTRAINEILNNYLHGANAAGNPSNIGMFEAVNMTPTIEPLWDASINLTKEVSDEAKRLLGLAGEATPKPRIRKSSSDVRATDKKEQKPKPEKSGTIVDAPKPKPVKPEQSEEAAARIQRALEHLEKQGFKVGDRVELEVPLAGGLGGTEKVAGTIRQAKTKYVYVETDKGQQWSLVDNPWTKLESAPAADADEWAQLKEDFPEEQQRFELLQDFYTSNREIVDAVLLGRATAAQLKQFRSVAKSWGIQKADQDAMIAEGESNETLRLKADDVLARLKESEDEAIKAIALIVDRRRLTHGSGEAGKAAVEDLVRALDKFAYLRSINTRVEDYLRQGSLFAGVELSSMQVDMLRAFERHGERKRVVDRLVLEFLGEIQQGREEFSGDPLEEVVQGALFKRTAYHGSPYDFDSFSSDAIGTGEGAQAYGWGLYFASRKDVAEHYRNAFAAEVFVSVGGLDYYSIELTRASASRQGLRNLSPTEVYALSGALLVPPASTRQLRKRLKNEAWRIRRLLSQGRDFEPGFREERAAVADASERLAKTAQLTTPNAKLYQVELAPEEDEYLLWDKPLSDQSEKVKQILADAWLAHPETHATESGEEIYRQAALARLRSEDLGADREWTEAERMASLDLRSLGIRGIKYLDGTSRAEGEGTYNYVIFDDADVSITGRFRREPPYYKREDVVDILANVRVTRRGHRVKLNAEAYQLIRAVFEQLEFEISGQPHNISFSGAFNNRDEVNRIVRMLTQVAHEHPRHKKPVAALVRALREAAGDHGTVILYTKEGALIHEGFHRSSELGAQGRGMLSRHARLEELFDHPVFDKVADQLVAKGYHVDAPGQIVEEIAAYIWEDDYQQFGISEEEAADYLDLWFRSYTERNGRRSIKEFEREREEAKAIIRRADDKRRQDVRRFLGGRQGRNKAAPARDEKSERGDPRLKRDDGLDEEDLKGAERWRKAEAKRRQKAAPLLTATGALAEPTKEEAIAHRRRVMEMVEERRSAWAKSDRRTQAMADAMREAAREFLTPEDFQNAERYWADSKRPKSAEYAADYWRSVLRKSTFNLEERERALAGKLRESAKEILSKREFAAADQQAEGYRRVFPDNYGIHQFFTWRDALEKAGVDFHEDLGLPLFKRTAYHGSPHDFDSFSTDAIGTGEGAQAYGWGLYFTEKKQIADHYKQRLSQRGRTLLTPQVNIDLGKFDYLGFDSVGEAVMAIASHADWVQRWDVRPTNENEERALQRLRAHFQLGKTYEVELAPEEDEYLLWDKPLSDQSEKVKQALAGLGINDKPEWRKTTFFGREKWEWVNGINADLWIQQLPGGRFEVYWGSIELTVGAVKTADEAKELANRAIEARFLNGEAIYHGLQPDATARATSSLLRSLGIRGIKYLDGTSRSKGEGTYNYVIFDDADVSITGRFRRDSDETGPSLREQLFAPPRFKRDAPPRKRALPAPAAKPIATMRRADRMQQHPDYAAAKSGNAAAAVRLVNDLVGEAELEQARSLPAGAVLMPLHAVEARGLNRIPMALAQRYAAATGLTVDDRIVQANKTFHTGANAMERLVTPASFAGHVKRGAQYVLVDDVVTLGGTLAAAADYIQQHGGKIAGIIVLANASRTSTLAPAAKLIREIESRYGDAVRKELGVEPAALTATEAGYLIGFKSAESLRTRAAAARQENLRRRDQAAAGRTRLRREEPEEIDPRQRLFRALYRARNREYTPRRASGQRSPVERDRPDRPVPDADWPAIQPHAGTAEPGPRAGSEPSGTARSGSGSSARLPDSGAAAGGTQSNSGLQTDALSEPQPGGRVAGSEHDSGRGDFGHKTAPAEPRASDAVDRATRKAQQLRDKRRAQREADTIPIKVGDRGNIAATLPFLYPHQHENVLKAEERLAKPNGFGMLFTDGTGTGKTYTGLGIIYRYARRGLDNIIIVAPNDKIIDDWIRSAANLNLHVRRLENTRDNGRQGIVITTYANFGQNPELVKRKWDLVVTDEAHNLSTNKDGSATLALQQLRAITMHPDGGWDREGMVLWDQYAELTDLEARIKAATASLDDQGNQLAAMRRLNELTDRREELQEEIKRLGKPIRAEVAATRPEDRVRAVMLSATPFSYQTSLRYAQNWLFDWNEGFTGDSGAYNAPSAEQAFFITHLGWRMRYGRLTRPDVDVNSDIMEQQLHEWLKHNQQSLSSTRLEIDVDYERKFVLLADAIGRQIDEGLEWLARAEDGRFAPLFELVNKNFTYLNRMFLLESLKARSFVPVIKQQLAMGRKVLVVHDFNKGGGFHPFKFERDETGAITYVVKGSQADQRRAVQMEELVTEFEQKRPDLVNLDFSGLRTPIETMRAAFGDDVLFFNGQVNNKQRAENLALWNADDSGKNLLVAQSDAAREGLNAHDTTGKHQRVEINLGMPVRPTKAIQLEGRIRRDGAVSDAIYIYGTTGTNFETWTFAQTISQRAGTAENLGMGSQARALREAFVDAYENAIEGYEPSADEGKGGVEADSRRAVDMTPFERAKTYYFAQRKRTSRDKSAEGVDYFATPEPLGLKMVEWADVQPGDYLLEPSAGHGAIARFFPPDSHRTMVEPSFELSSRLGLVADGRIVQERFENLHVTNKYDAIIMNPPFGHGGKTALDHVRKAASHLRDGGRIVALIPTGPAADKQLERFEDSEDAKDLYRVADIQLPGVVFERAGTSVRTHVVIFEKQVDKQRAQRVQEVHRDFSDAEKIKDFFDRIEESTVPARVPVPEEAKEAPAAEQADEAAVPDGPRAETANYKVAEFKHTQTGAQLYVASPKGHLGNDWKPTLAKAKQHGGYYSKYKQDGAIPGFIFKSAEERGAFLRSVGEQEIGAGEDEAGLGELGAPARLPANALAATNQRIQVQPLTTAPANRKGLRPHAIIRKLNKALGKRVFTGSPGRGRGGSYNPASSKPLIRFTGDLDTTAHEIAHWLDDQFKLVAGWAKPRARSPFDAELIPRFSQHGTTKKNVSLQEQRAEGVAEWIRALIANPGAARGAAPQFYQHFMQTVPADVRTALKEFSDDVRAFASLSAVDRTAANVQLRPEKEGLLERLRTALKGDGYTFETTAIDRLVAATQDSLRPLVKGIQAAKDIRQLGPLLPSQDPETLVRLVAGSNDKYDDMLEHGLVDAKNQRVTGGGFEWLLEPLTTNTVTTAGGNTVSTRRKVSRAELEREMELTIVLMVNQRILEKAQQVQQLADDAIAKLNPADPRFKQKRDRIQAAADARKARLAGTGGGIYADDKQALEALFELTQDPDRLDRLSRAADRYREWMDRVLLYWVEKGRLSEKSYNRIKEKNEYYVAFKRLADSIDERVIPKATTTKLGSTYKGIYRFKGSTREIVNPYFDLMDQTFRFYKEADRNYALRTFRELLTTSRKMYQGDVEDLSAIGSRVPRGTRNAFRIVVDGNEEFWKFERGIEQALKNWGEIHDQNIIYRILELPRKLTQFAVTHSPDFLVRNVLRDATHRSVVSRSGSKPWDILKGFSSEQLSAYKLAGGGQAGHYLTSREAYGKQLRRAIKELSTDKSTILSLPGKLLGGYGALARGSELIGRMAEYKRAFEKGKKELGYDDYNASLYAALQARQLIDYAVAGTVGRKLSRFIPFFNPAIQGPARIWRGVRENPVAFTARWSVYVLLPTMLLYAYHAAQGPDDEEEYRQQPNYIRDFFWNIKLGPDLWLRIPKPFELGVFASGVERAIDAARGKKNAFDGYPHSLINSVTPFDEGTLAGPFKAIVETMANYDFFRERAIVSPFEADKDLELRKGNARASRIGQAFEKVLRVDARYIDHVITASTGGLGRITLHVSDIGREDKRRAYTQWANDAVGLFVASPAFQAKDTQFVLDRARGRGEQGSTQMRMFGELLDEYSSATSPTERDEKARRVREAARELRRYFEGADASALAAYLPEALPPAKREKADREMNRLNYRPKFVGDNIKIGDEEIRIESPQFREYAQQVGEELYAGINRMIERPGYQRLTDEEKARAIEMWGERLRDLQLLRLKHSLRPDNEEIERQLRRAEARMEERDDVLDSIIDQAEGKRFELRPRR